MVGSTETIGRLIANEVLLQAERQLLQNRDQPQPQQQDKPASAVPAPVSHNDKAVLSSVLFTLLDEQLVAAVPNSPDRAAHFVSGSTSPGEVATTTSRVAAPYAEADTAFRPDTRIEQPILPPNVTNQQQAMLAAASPELRIAMQSAFFSAAVRAQTGVEEEARKDGRRRDTESATNSTALLRVAAVAVAGLAVAIFLAAGFVR
ncbi:MAG TPA: hypothetical protein PKE16_06050 [Hyphomicrobium sp.]|nr:hypothetical protein [Hyphomicrobium sp.]